MIKLALLLIIFSYQLLADEFGLSFRYMKAKYLPYEYTPLVESPTPQNLQARSELKSNTREITPIDIIWKKTGTPWTFSISRYRIDLNEPYTDLYFTNGLSPAFTRTTFRPASREERSVRSFYHFNYFRNSDLFVGAGLRNIYRVSTRTSSIGINREEIGTLGPEINAGISFYIIDHFYFQFMAYGFITSGDRDFSFSSVTSQTNFVLAQTSSKTLGIFMGYELNFTLGYKPSKNFEIFVGFDTINSHLKYYRQRDFIWSSNNGNLSFSQTILRDPVADRVSGFYCGARTYISFEN
jgi:outer membrane protein (TIGR04327 family)